MMPRLAASRINKASPVVSIQPDQGGSVHVVCAPEAIGKMFAALLDCQNKV
jgi:hypothetical protein